MYRLGAQHAKCSIASVRITLKLNGTTSLLGFEKYGLERPSSFKVKKCLKYDNYELELPERMQIHPVFHISLLSKTKNPTTEEDLEVKDDEYEVDEILNKRITNGQTEYLVKWLGYDESEATWEPTRNLYCPEKIQEFEDSNSTKRVPEKVFG